MAQEAKQPMNTSGTTDVDRIRERAYELWRQDGCPEGRAMDYWLRAEADLRGEADAAVPGGGESATGQGEAAPAPMDEPKTSRATRARKAPQTKSEPEPAARAAQADKGRAGYVQQKRTRRKAEG